MPPSGVSEHQRGRRGGMDVDISWAERGERERQTDRGRGRERERNRWVSHLLDGGTAREMKR